MKHKNKIEFNNFYDNFGELNGWDYHVEEFEHSQNLLKVLQKKIALPKVQNKEKNYQKSLKRLQTIPTIEQINKYCHKKQLSSVDSENIGKNSPYSKIIKNRHNNLLRLRSQQTKPRQSYKVEEQRQKKKCKCLQKNSEKELSSQNLTARSKNEKYNHHLKSFGILKIEKQSLHSQTKKENTSQEKRNNSQKNRISLDVLSKPTKRNINEMSTDKLDKLVMKTKTKVNWGKFKISRDKINFLNNQKEVQKRTLVKKFERNKTLNILDKNIMIPGILQNKRKQKKTILESGDDFVDDHLQDHQRLKTNFL